MVRSDQNLKKSLTDEVLQAYKTLLLGNRIKIYFPNSGGSYCEVKPDDIVQYLYNHVRSCQLRALHDFFQDMTKVLCQIRDLLTVTAL
jgi:hypothetical protein